MIRCPNAGEGSKPGALVGAALTAAPAVLFVVELVIDMSVAGSDTIKNFREARVVEQKKQWKKNPHFNLMCSSAYILITGLDNNKIL